MSSAVPAESGPTDRIQEPEGSVPSGIRGPFFQEIGQRKQQGRDAKILVTAADGQTGVGKSNLCDFLGYVLDTSAEGYVPNKVVIEPERFLELYSVLSKGSVLVLEEAEQFDSRRSQRNENVEASHKWQQYRVREIIALLNLPDPSMIDTRFETLADYWINVERRGLCRIYKKKIHPIKRSVYYKTLQTFEWPNMDGSVTFQRMDKLKDGLLEGETGKDGLIRESEAEERVQRAKKKVRENCRDEWIRALKRIGMTGKEIAALPPVDVKAARVNQIARGE